MEKRNAEISRLNLQAEEHQESLKVSSAQNIKLTGEINELRGRFGETSKETQDHK